MPLRYYLLTLAMERMALRVEQSIRAGNLDRARRQQLAAFRLFKWSMQNAI